MTESRWRDERGLALPIVALLITTLVLMASFAVDLGRQRADRRLAQAAADVVAIDMMRVVGNNTFQQLSTDAVTLAMVDGALDDSAENNGFTNTFRKVVSVDAHTPRITNLQWGMIVAGSGGETFKPLVSGADTDLDGTPDLQEVPNAVMITAQRTTDFYFRTGDRSVTRRAIAGFPQPVVDLSIGSVGAGFQPGYPVASATLTATVQALNARLHAQFNATTPNPSTSFDLLGYQGLAAADVDVWRVAANAGFASPDEMLESDMTAGEFFDATASALDQEAAEGDPNAANASTQLERFRTQMGVDSASTMRMGDTMNFEQGGEDAAAEGSINVLDLLSGGADVIDDDDGDGDPAHFVNYQFDSAIPFPAGPEFVSVDVSQYLVAPETHRFRLGVGGTATNSQARFQVDITVAPLTGMPGPAINCKGSPHACVTIPLVIEAVNATGRVNRLDCADPLTGSEAGIGVTTSGVTVTLGTATDLTANTLLITPGVLVQSAAQFGSPILNANVLIALGLNPLLVVINNDTALTATASASSLGGASSHTFLPYQPPVPYQRSPGGVGAATLSSQLTSTLSASIGSTVLNSTAENLLMAQLNYVFTNLQAEIIDPILQQAGVTAFGADLKAQNMRCEGAGLRLLG